MPLVNTVDFDGAKTRVFKGAISSSYAPATGAGSFLERDHVSYIPNSEDGNRTHPDFPFMVKSGLSFVVTGGITMTRHWTAEEGVTADWFVEHAKLVNESMGGYGSFEYTDVDMEAMTCSSRLVSSLDRYHWGNYPVQWELLINNVKVEYDEGATIMCVLRIAEDWENWDTKVRDVAANTNEVISTPSPSSKEMYISFNQDALINDKAYPGGTTLKLASGEFKITTGKNTKLIASFK
jgi:hypothetical protein